MAASSLEGPSQVPQPKAGPRPREIAHLVLRTAQPEVMIDWYCSVLGLQPVLRSPLINFLTWDHTQNRLAILPVPQSAIDAAKALGDKAAPPVTGLDHVAFTYNSLADVIAVYRDVATKGIAPYWCVNHGVTTALYFHDPDGNVVELSVDNFRDLASLNAWLATGAFNTNLIGVTLDVEDLARRIDGGEPEAEILRPHPDHAARFENELARMGLTLESLGV
jgi:catechol-2,3-dioxygenase